MWKLLVGFALFAVLAVFLLMKSGADVDMGGEKHGIDAGDHSVDVAPAPAVTAPASATSAP